MRDRLVRKVLVIGIIVLFIWVGINPIMMGYKSQQENQIPYISNQTNSLPDLKIIGAYVKYRRGCPNCFIQLHNYGDASIDNTDVACSLTIKRILTHEVLCSYTQSFWIDTLVPKGTKDYLVGGLCVETMPISFRGFIYFNIDPNDKVKESNERNNLVRGYINGGVMFVIPEGCSCNYNIGKLRQYSSNNIDISNFPLLYYLPLLTQNIRYILPLEIIN